MINSNLNTTTSKHFGIVLPNTNKALGEALKNASPKELETLSPSKDLKSMMSDILKQTTNDTSSNKVLLELVKNNPTLKNLGSVSTTIKDLLSSIKSDKEQSPTEKTLKNFLTDIKDLKGDELKEKLVKTDKKTITTSNKTQTTVQKFASEVQKILSSSSDETSHINDKKTVSKTPQVKTPQNEQDTKIKQPTLKEQTVPKESQVQQKSQPEIKIKVQLQTQSQTQTKVQPQIQPMQKNEQSVENVLKSFLTSVQDLEGDDLNQKLNDLNSLLKSSFDDEDIASDDLKKVFSAVSKKESHPIEKTLKNFLLDIKDLKGDELKNKFLNSGVFLESNLKEAKDSPEKVKDIVNNDLKAILSKASEEISNSSSPNQQEILKNIDKLLLQIDNYQLLSYLSNGSSLYLPFSWDQLEDGKIELKQVKEDKFFCNIDLKLKDFGDINLKLVLYDENQINLQVYSKSDDFRSLVKDNIAQLRSSLIDINITPREIRVFDFKEDKKVMPSAYSTMDDNLKMGFEIKA
ncbi:MAG: hypothetical protein ABGW74_01135 [Campylobacterales bacterium]